MDEDTGLGLGLNALFDENDSGPVSAEIAAMEKKVLAEGGDTHKRLNVGIGQLRPSRFQPRRIFCDESLEELAESIRQYGVLQPLLVRKDPDSEDCYEIIAGERRWRAAQAAQIHDVPVIILDIHEIDAFKIALIENLQREDLDPMDEAAGYQRLLEEYGQTQADLAMSVGKSRSHIANMVRLLTLPNMVQAYISAGDISMGHARALITAEDPEALAKQVISKKLSVRQTEKLAKQQKGDGQDDDEIVCIDKDFSEDQLDKPANGKTTEKDADTLALEKDMSNALGMNVSIDSPDGHAGKLSIEFKSLDQLDELLHRLAQSPSAGRLDG